MTEVGILFDKKEYWSDSNKMCNESNGSSILIKMLEPD